MNAIRSILEFDDPGASDDEPVKGVTMGHIRAWHDSYAELDGKYAMTEKRPQEKHVHPLKWGNLFWEVPLDVAYAGCAHLECIEGCNIGKGHCQRLENAFEAAGYARLS
jgi:hypothetical protein